MNDRLSEWNTNFGAIPPPCLLGSEWAAAYRRTHPIRIPVVGIPQHTPLPGGKITWFRESILFEVQCPYRHNIHCKHCKKHCKCVHSATWWSWWWCRCTNELDRSFTIHFHQTYKSDDNKEWHNTRITVITINLHLLEMAEISTIIWSNVLRSGFW